MKTLEKFSNNDSLQPAGSDYTVVSFWALSDGARDRVDQRFSDYSHTEEARLAPVVPVPRGDINNFARRPFGVVAYHNTDSHFEDPASYLGATPPVEHNGRMISEAGSMMTLPEHRGSRLARYTLELLSRDLSALDITPMSSANQASRGRYDDNGFRPAERHEIPDSVTEFCRTECPKRILLEAGRICCDTNMVLDINEWEQTEGGVYVPPSFSTDETIGED